MDPVAAGMHRAAVLLGICSARTWLYGTTARKRGLRYRQGNSYRSVQAEVPVTAVSYGMIRDSIA